MEEHCVAVFAQETISIKPKTTNGQSRSQVDGCMFCSYCVVCCVLCCASVYNNCHRSQFALYDPIIVLLCISTYVLFLLLYFIIISFRCHSFSLNTWARAYRPSCHHLSVCVCAIVVGGERRVAKRNGINSRAHTKDIFICGNGDMRMGIYTITAIIII